MDAKQNFLETVTWGKPTALVNQWEALQLQIDPLMSLGGSPQPGKTVVDTWGVSLHWGDGEPGPMPLTEGKWQVCPDITRWRDYIKQPDLEGAQLDWTDAKAQAQAIRESGKLVTSLMVGGLFERSHFLMGFEDTLVNLALEPEAMHELLDCILDFKITYLRILIENSKPDAILSHDDWGTKMNLFMRPDTWREFFKPRYEKFYKYAKDNDIIVIHHADSHCEEIAYDMTEVHIDVWQGVLPQNNIPKIQKEVQGKMVLMGGIDAAIVDHKGIDEEIVRQEVRRACEEYVPGGGFIPCLTYGTEGSIYPGINDIISDEIHKLSPKYF